MTEQSESAATPEDGDNGPSAAIQPSAVEFWVGFFNRNPPQPGDCDLVCVGPDPEYQRLLNLVLLFFYAIHDGTGRSPFEAVRIVIPPGKSAVDTKSQLVSGVCRTVEEGRSQHVSPKELAALNTRIMVDTAPDLEAASALELLRQIPAKSAAVIVDAARYSSRQDTAPRASSRFYRSEDLWVRNLYALVRSAVELAAQRQLYVLVDGGEFSPVEIDNQELLKSIDGSAFYAAGPIGDEEARSRHSAIAAAERYLAEGLVGEAFASIASISGISEDQRLLLKVQVLKNHGHAKEALDLVKPELERLIPRINGEGLVELGIVAADSEYPLLAERLLNQSLRLLHHEHSLAAALELANRLGVSAAAAELESRLAKLFPHSPDLLSHRIASTLGDRDYSTLAELVDCAPTPPAFPAELLKFYKHVANALGVEGDPDYDALLALVEERTPRYVDRARLLAARDARSRGRLIEAVELAADVNPHSRSAASAADVAIGTLEELLIGRDPDTRITSLQEIQAPIEDIIKSVSENPSAAGNRNALARLLSVEICATDGLVLLASLSLNLAALPVEIRAEAPRVQPPSVDLELLKAFMRDAVEYFGQRSPIIIGKGVLPEALLTADVGALLEKVVRLLDVDSDTLLSESDRQSTLLTLHIAILLARKNEDPSLELTLVRLVAGKFAAVGHAQRARDLAEGVLQEVEASASSARKRQAWFTFADIYHRTGNHHEALLALVCALSQRDAVTSQEQLWQETFLHARILRDLDLTDQALLVVTQSRLVLGRMGLEARYGHRLDLLQRTVVLRDLLRERTTGQPAADAWHSLVMAIVGDCRAALDKDDDPAPGAMLLGQALLYCRVHDMVVDENARTTFEEILGRVGEPMASRIRTLSVTAPSVEDVTALTHTLDAARYGDDIGFDVRAIAIAARRLLSSEAAVQNPAIAAFAIELLSDQTVCPPRSNTTGDAAPAVTPREVQELARFARATSEDGLAIHLLAFDEAHKLCRVTVEAGELREMVKESESMFSRDRFRAWRREYPYKYSDLETQSALIANAFRQSVNGLGISHATVPRSRAVVVPEIQLQEFPPNILISGPHPYEASFAGDNLAIASVPSLSWLRGVRLGHRSSNGRRFAWISTGTRDAGVSGTLDMLASRLTDTFERHAIVLHEGAEPPEDLSGSDLVIVGAHGSLSVEGRYFRVASDEGTLRMTARQLAMQIGAANVVILFICSGARADSHPLANATVGLPRLLLDSGVRVVLASPWPLDSRVPSHWLPAFLEASRRGSAVIDANFIANQAVKQAMGDHPSRYLAMTVVGDPLVVAPAGPRQPAVSSEVSQRKPAS